MDSLTRFGLIAVSLMSAVAIVFMAFALVDVTGLVIYFSGAMILLRGTLL